MHASYVYWKSEYYTELLVPWILQWIHTNREVEQLLWRCLTIKLPNVKMSVRSILSFWNLPFKSVQLVSLPALMEMLVPTVPNRHTRQYRVMGFVRLAQPDSSRPKPDPPTRQNAVSIPTDFTILSRGPWKNLSKIFFKINDKFSLISLFKRYLPLNNFPDIFQNKI